MMTSTPATTAPAPQPATQTVWTRISRPKGKVTKLKLLTKGFRPGSSSGISNVTTTAYFIVLGIPLTSPIGTTDEIAQVHGFAEGLTNIAGSAKLGVVDRVAIAKGLAEVSLRLNLPNDFPSEPTDQQKDDLVSEAFKGLSDFLAQAEALKVGSSGHVATWAFKANGSVLDDGQF